ncbi:hypothetical protein FHS40_000466 [Streptomyces spectabilis]|uniref:Uncharacterized protein n=1 Tax=Streptomyces spectabilis TaxID=68270 RepID=A0A7W8ERU7_STRST|nr:hypothetical protein [Streptomyces spectabilis]
MRLTSRAVAHGMPAEGCDVLLCEAECDRAPAEGEPAHHTPGATFAIGRAE